MSEAAGEVRGPVRVPWRSSMLVVMALLGAAVLVALIVTLGNANRARDRALQLQGHSYEVMILARTLSGTIARSEASLGRYVISGDQKQGRQLGRQYVDEWQSAASQIDTLDIVTDDNPRQQALIDGLRRAFQERGAELSLIALSTSYRKNDQALARYYQAAQAPSLAHINDLLDRIIVRERSLLDRRSSDAATFVARSTAAARVLAAFGVLIAIGAIVLGWLTVRALAEGAIAAADADAERLRAEELEIAVGRATAELRTQEGRLRQVQKMEAIGQLTGGIAHDFNNMLAVVLGGLELARRTLADPDATRRHLDNAVEGANRAAALTRRLLAFSREEALNLEPIDAGALIAGMADLLDRTLGDAIIVTAHHGGDGWLVRADRYQLENVILNLAVNARDAMDGRGQLTIATASASLVGEAVGACAAGDYVTIAVTDSGCGMTPDIIERVFEPFFTTKPIGKGTGLGLSQIFAFVRQARGEIGIDSSPGEGTTVTLYLPREMRDGVAPTPLSVQPHLSSAELAIDILVVEDDPRVLTATMGALEELGHRPVACSDPLTAPALLDTHPIDLIVSDVLMPGQTGPEMIAALEARYPDIAVLFVTGYAGEEAEFGGRSVLRKPFTMAALERAIGVAMSTSSREIAPQSIAAE